MSSKQSPINRFRTHQYRVFLAEPYFKLDLEKEVKWHEEHLKKLNLQSKNPDLFHKARTSHKIEDRHHQHFQEHVIESIPFHKEILENHKKRLKTILDIMPEKTYQKIRKISKKHDTVAEYLVFDKIARKFFFLVEQPTPEKEKWSKVIEKKRLAEIMFLE